MIYDLLDIRHIKLTTGDELLAEIIDENEYEILVRNPLLIYKERMIIKGITKEANFFSRWMSFTAAQEFIIDRRHIVVEGLADEAVINHYCQLIDNINQSNEVHVNKDSTDHDELSLSQNEDISEKPTYH